jgi:2-polyprenyl-3-methyl-5-hydroxy-6-metoxy-1,4-benzoquinol methylase
MEGRVMTIKVAAPDKWMNGWDKLYRKMLKSDDLSKLEPHHVHYPIQQLFWFTKPQEEAPAARELKAAELACGDGRVACYLAQMGYTVETVDALPSAVELTQKRAEQLQLADRVTVSLGDIDTWEVKPSTFDLVVALQCLQYLFERTMPRLREVMASVKPEGFFVYSGNILPHEPTERPIRFITEEELKAALEGWTIHSLGTNVIRRSAQSTRGYLFAVAQKEAS